MNRIASDTDVLVARCRDIAQNPQGQDGWADVLVIGSGYGGAVAAQRFAQAGQSVWVLERGAEYLAGDFPSDPGNAPRHLRMESGQGARAQAHGYDKALFDFRRGQGASALLGNGLGGGSLINAAVALPADDRVFDLPEWPQALRGAASMQDWYQRARQGLEVQDGAQQRQAPDCVPQHTLKYARLRDIAQASQQAPQSELRVRFDDVPLAVEFRANPPQQWGPRQACNGCGNCVSGCNFNAKLSLDKSYLARAHGAGAALYTGVTVLWLSHEPDARHPGHPWVVHALRTAERTLWENLPAEQRGAYTFTLRAAQVVVSGGTFGSTELLLRSQRMGGLALATQSLGRGISANGDDLSAAYDLPQPAQGFGQAPGVPAQRPVAGPTISGIIHFDHARDVRLSTVTEDGAIPGLLRPLVSQVLGLLGTLPQLTRWGRRHPEAADDDCIQPSNVHNSLVMLGMGHDRAAGVASLDQVQSRLSWAWREAPPMAAAAAQPEDALPLHRQRLKVIERLQGVFLPNPALGLLPDALKEVLGQSDVATGWITVHPLGGCRMADTPAQGVVNDRCQVYTPEGGVHTGLYVMDGSVVPRSLGVNPLLTITALAERACALALADTQAPQRTARTAATRPAPAAAPALPAAERAGLAHDGAQQTPHPKTTDARAGTGQAAAQGEARAARSDAADKAAPAGACGTSLNEVLRGPLQWDAVPTGLDPALDAALAATEAVNGSLHAALFLEMDVQDWDALWADPRHQARVTPGQRSPMKDDSHFTRSRLVLDLGAAGSLCWPVSAGTVDIFHPTRSGFLARLWRVLPVLATYLIGRWWPDRKRPRSSQQPLWRLFIESIRMSWRATEARGFTYRLRIDANGVPLELAGTKYIQAAASGADFWRWLGQKWQQGGWPVLVRRSVWAQLTELDVVLRQPGSGQRLACGRLGMDLPEMVRRVVPQLLPGPDIVQAMTAILSYPTVLVRHILSSRLLDFRLPDYRPDLPPTDWASEPGDAGTRLRRSDYPALALRDGRQVPPEEPVELRVPLHRAGTVPPEAQQDISVGLVRYRQPVVSCQLAQGMRRYRSILLMNGFAQNTLPFVATELGADNLATQLYEQGWDVWLFEYRVSPFLRASALSSSMDDIAAGDIPAAVAHVLQTLADEQGQAFDKGQVFLFSHCVGSASLGMSLLGGQLRHNDAAGSSQLAGVLLSQFQPFVVGSYTAQMRLNVAGALVNALGLSDIQFSAGTVQADAMHSLLDRLFASFDVDPHERCPHEHDLRDLQPDSTTCKRMAGLLSRLFVHDQLLLRTHEQLDRYFGRTNLGVFMHGAHCVENERLVNAQGQNVYLTSANVRRYLDMPLMLIHGEKNVLFDREGLAESRRQLTRHFGRARLQAGLDVFLEIPGMAHFDCTIGKDAPARVFAPVLRFFDQAWRQPHPASTQVPRLRARLPQTGPQIGWTRQQGAERVMRVWMEVDTQQSDQALCAMTVLCVNGQRRVQCWPLRQELLRTGLAPLPAAPGGDSEAAQAISYAVADLRWPESASGTVSVAMVSLHHYSEGDEAELTPEHPSWAAPLGLSDIQNAQGRTPARRGAALALPQGLPSGARLSVPWPIGAQPEPGSAGMVEPDPAPDRVPAQVAPLDLVLSLDDARALLRPMLHLLAQARTLALRADPGTLSRQRRTLRSFLPATLRLREASWRSPALRMFLGTCRHPGLSPLEGWRRDTQLLALARRQQERAAALMWMVGDQIYADATAGLADSFLPIERFLPKYREAFGSSGFRQLARQLPLYMVMDDHEISDNWGRDELRTGALQQLCFDNAWASFRAFQQAHGPASLRTAACDAVLDTAGLSFYRLNTRLYRDRLAGQTLHAAQWAALQAWLLAQQALGMQPKFIVSGSVLAPGLRAGIDNPWDRTGDTWQAFGADRLRLLDFIQQQRIHNVVFLSGDYHCSASATLHFPDPALKAYALVSPPLYASAPFANVAVQDVLPHEAVVLSGAAGTVQIEARAYAGEGWLECEVARNASGQWRLQAEFRVTPLGQTQQQVHALAHAF